MSDENLQLLIKKNVSELVNIINMYPEFHLEDEDKTKSLMLRNISSFLSGSSFNTYLEEEVKESIVPLTYSESFIKTFLKEKLYVTEVNKDIIDSFRIHCRIYFFDENKYELKEKSKKYPSAVYIPQVRKNELINGILAHSTHPIIEKIHFVSLFSTKNSYSKELVLFIKRELDPLVIPLLTSLQARLNEKISEFQDELKNVGAAI
ncbi:hypothetical protein [Priestia aryabhattai]